MFAIALPPGEWAVDPAQAHVSFSGRVSRFAPTFRARFGRVTGRLVVTDSPQTSRVEVDIDLTTMTSGVRAYDELLRSLDPLETTRHPVATFRSTCVEVDGDGGRVDGELTLRGVTRPVALQARPGVHASARTPLLRAVGTVDRSDFGIRCELPGLAALVPRQMTVEIAVATVAMDASLAR